MPPCFCYYRAGQNPAPKTVGEGMRLCSPVLHGVEGLFIGNVIHEDKTHGSPVVGSGDGPVPFLPCCVLGGRKDGGQRGPTREQLRVETNSEIVQSSPGENWRGAGASPKAQWVRKADWSPTRRTWGSTTLWRQVPTESFSHSFNIPAR